jgi:hypothetical protein
MAAMRIPSAGLGIFEARSRTRTRGRVICVEGVEELQH